MRAFKRDFLTFILNLQVVNPESGLRFKTLDSVNVDFQLQSGLGDLPFRIALNLWTLGTYGLAPILEGSGLRFDLPRFLPQCGVGFEDLS